MQKKGQGPQELKHIKATKGEVGWVCRGDEDAAHTLDMLPRSCIRPEITGNSETLVHEKHETGAIEGNAPIH